MPKTTRTQKQLKERYKYVTGKQKVHGTVIPCPDDDGCLNRDHWQQLTDKLDTAPAASE